MPVINQKHKDRLFQRLFGDAENKKNLLTLYNALNHTDYDDETLLEIYTIDDAIYMGMKNDVACIICDWMTLMEHQSSYNPNMPVRGLIYFGRLYDKYISENGINIYSSKLKMLPTPKYYVFYNGGKEQPDRSTFRLSDAFIHPDKSGDFEWTVCMVNINYGHNKELMDACTVLKDYAILVMKINEYKEKGETIEESVNHAVGDCIKEDVLKDYLTAHKAEVIGMVLTEYDEAKTFAAIRDESFDEGFDEGFGKGFGKGFGTGFDKGYSEGIIKMLKKYNESDDYILEKLMSELDISKEEAEEYLDKYNKCVH